MRESNLDKFATNNMRAQPEKKKEPLPSNERYRDYKLPSGLKNIGNSKYIICMFRIVIIYLFVVACYFASLVQVLFHLPNFS
jgi:ubiquitin C-terminal hydrolase